MHPFALASRRHNSRPSEISKVPRNLGLALSEYLNEVADANLPSVHEVQQPQTGAICQRGEQQSHVVILRRNTHSSIIYALTDMSISKYIRLSVCKETQSWNRRRAFSSR